MIKKLEVGKKYLLHGKTHPNRSYAGYKNAKFLVTEAKNGRVYGDVLNPSEIKQDFIVKVPLSFEDGVPTDPEDWDEIVEAPKYKSHQTYDEMMQFKLASEGIEVCIQCKKAPPTTAKALCRECSDKAKKHTFTGPWKKYVPAAWQPRDVDMDIPDA